MNRSINRITLIISLFISILFTEDITQINRIKIDGNKRLSNDDIIRISNIYPGMKIQSVEIQQGINRLWDLNRFNDKMPVNYLNFKNLILKQLSN